VNDPLVHAVHYFLELTIIVNVIAVVLESEPSLKQNYDLLFLAIEVASSIIFTLEYAARLWCAPEHAPWQHLKPWRARLKWALHPQSVIDFLAILPFYLAYWDAGALRALLLFRLFRFFKLTRYSPGLASLAEAIYSERRALAACGVILLGAILVAASIMHLAEHNVQPDKFGTIPEAMYWAVITLTTVGYGDVAPVTPLGQLIAAVTAIMGLVMLALPVGIIASAFSREIHRRDFVVTWSMVARVPLFSELNAQEIATVMQCLHSRSCVPGEVIVRKGDVAHAMYMIASGDVEVVLSGENVRLGPGDFFGEMGVLKRRHRAATVKALTACRLLVLDSEDLHELMDANPSMAQRVREVAQARETGRSL
jgi:voltage-gated potassium channel